MSESADNITHQACHNIDTAKELQKSGQGNTGTVNSGVLAFPIAMTPDYKEIQRCIYVSDISNCESNMLDTGHGLVMHLDANTAYEYYYDYYSDY